MPTPIYALRLPQQVQDDLAELGRVCGYPNGRALAKEALEAVTSGDPQRVQDFARKLALRVGEQLPLQLAPQRPPRRVKREKRRGRRGRAT